MELRVPAEWNVRTVFLEEIGIPDWEWLAFVFSIVELNTAVKASFIRWLFLKGAEWVVYLDPDIQVFDDLCALIDGYDGDVILTPHILEPISQDYPYEDRIILKSGIFNLGFVGFHNTLGAHRLLAWWEDRCLSEGFDDAGSGLFVDQKWANLFVGLSEKCDILRQVGCNVAYWNLGERRLSRAGDGWAVNDKEPLIFFHFSGFKRDILPEMTTHVPGFYAGENTAVRQLFEEYERELVLAEERWDKRDGYTFGVFKDGSGIPDLARKLAIGYQLDHPGWSEPFDRSGGWKSFLLKVGAGRGRAGKVPKNPREANFVDWRVRCSNFGLRLTAFVIGLENYRTVMRYLTFVGFGKNQNYVFFAAGTVGVVSLKSRLGRHCRKTTREF
jgi:hypothetical protein